MESWGTTWPVGLLVVVVVLAIIDAIQRARSSGKESESFPMTDIIVQVRPISTTVKEDR